MALSAERTIGYTGALKFLQIMATKGLVVRNEDQQAHIYRAAQPPEITKRQVVGDLMHKMFSGSAGQLVLHALQIKKASPEDLAEIRLMLDAYEAGAGRQPVEEDGGEFRVPQDNR